MQIWGVEIDRERVYAERRGRAAAAARARRTLVIEDTIFSKGVLTAFLFSHWESVSDEDQRKE